jgi:hypothetical protein
MAPTGPREVLAALLGCGNPTALAALAFLKGELESIPLPEGAVDVIISGGRLAVSDVVVRGPVPAAIRRGVERWLGCVAGALDESEYRAKLARRVRGDRARADACLPARG